MSLSLTRRSLLQVTGLGIASLPMHANAMGRIPLGGTLNLRVPWATARLDPHDLFDPLAGLFSAAMADPLYGLDSQGRPYPSLADGMPQRDKEETIVTLRPRLRSARGRRLSGNDLAWSCQRARQAGAAGLLAAAGRNIRVDPQNPLQVRFTGIEPDRLALVLASPLLALLPRGFSPTAPDGTGAFRARCSGTALELVRNPHAARGAAYLERVIIHHAADLSQSLEAFEAGKDDIGWLGLGLYQDRQGAKRFDHGQAGWVVLACGKQAGSFYVPGAAQQLANAIPTEQLHLGLQARKGLRAGRSWTGKPADLLYDRSQPQLRMIATTIAAKLSQPGHELNPRGLSRNDLRKRRRTEDFALALDLVRHPGIGLNGPEIALATGDRRSRGIDMGRRVSFDLRDLPGHRLTTTLRLGVVGGLGVSGGMRRGLVLAAEAHGHGIDFSNSYSLR